VTGASCSLLIRPTPCGELNSVEGPALLLPPPGDMTRLPTLPPIEGQPLAEWPASECVDVDGVQSVVVGDVGCVASEGTPIKVRGRLISSEILLTIAVCDHVRPASLWPVFWAGRFLGVL
jgi:hypothetical protein